MYKMHLLEELLLLSSDPKVCVPGVFIAIEGVCVGLILVAVPASCIEPCGALRRGETVLGDEG